MTDRHEEIRELLAGYALGAADADEAARVERHLEGGCPSCEAELRGWTAFVARLPEAEEAVEPSESTRARVLAAIGDEPAGVRASAERRSRRWPLALAASLLVGLGLLGLLRQGQLAGEIAALRAARDDARQRLALAEGELAASRSELARLRLAVSVAGSPLASTVRLAGLEAAPEAAGRTLVDPADGRAAFFAGGLAPAPEGRTYQLWLVVDGKPRSAGTFDVDDAGRALVVVESVAPPESIDNWAVTIEPAGGVPQPTGEMVLLG